MSKNSIRKIAWPVCGVGLFLWLVVWQRPLHAADAVVGTGTAASCTEAAFNTALSTVQSSGGGTITFDCGGEATIIFSSEKLITAPEVVLEGAEQITLSGGDVTRLFRVLSNGRLTLRNITLSNGYAGTNYGGAIYVSPNGTLFAENSTIKDSATNGWAGGAVIDFNGVVTLVDSLIENNHSSYGALNSTGSLTLIRTTIRNNTASSGGGAFSVGGEVILEDSTISGNRAPIGGAMYITAAAQVTVTGSTFAENEADGVIPEETGGGAILNEGWLSISRSAFWGNHSQGSGGALQNGFGIGEPYLFVEESTLMGNQAALFGGAIYQKYGALTAVNSTLSDNIAQESGGGLSSFLGPTTLSYVTVVRNQGGNLNQIAAAGNQDDRQRIYLSKTAVVGGSPNCVVNGSPAPDPIPYFSTQEHNLSDDDSCAIYLTGADDQNNTDAQLGPLAANGGPTLTHMPLGESPLLDAATCSNDHLHDQRGLLRPEADLCDIGAVEAAGIPLSQILPRHYRLALDHLESVRGSSMAPNWAEARLSLRATPFYRPDLPQPAYYEFPIEVPGAHGYEPAGFIIVSTGAHDFPIPHWSDEAEAPAQLLRRKSGELGSPLPVKFFRLDSLAYAAEDTQGGLSAMSDSTFNKIIRPAGPLPVVELSRLAWQPENTPPVDGVMSNTTYNLVTEGPISSTVQLGGWASWQEIRNEYTVTYEPYLDHLAEEAAEAWLAAQGPIALRPGESYLLPLIDAAADAQVSGAGAAWVTMEETEMSGGRRGITLLVTDGPETGSAPFQVHVSTPAEQVDFEILPPLTNIYLPLITASAGSARTSLQVNAPTAVTGWGSWRYDWAGGDADQRLYHQIRARTAQNQTSCPSGCGPTAWAMLFGWADHQAWIGNPRWAQRWGIYRVAGGPGPQTPNADAPRFMADVGVYNMTWEIRGYVGTGCVLGAGPTVPWRMADAQRYLSGRTYAWVDTQYNSIGWSENRLMNDAANSIIFNQTPAVIGTGWLNHYPLAWGYASRTYHYGLGFTRTTRYFYVNQGWGGASEWISASTWFSGELIP
ncbi:MAG: right-handed parallel beta-helix repeat-containing protein [Chloroflexota bacterium]